PEVRKPFGREDKLISLSTGDIKSDPPQVAVQAVLCWSEYYNGKWQAVKTSGVDHPADIGLKAFSRSRGDLWAAQEGDYLRVGLASADSSSFLLYNTHSVPKVDLPGHSDPVPPHPSRYLVGLYSQPIGKFSINYYYQDTIIPALDRPVLEADLNYRNIAP